MCHFNFLFHIFKGYIFLQCLYFGFVPFDCHQIRCFRERLGYVCNPRSLKEGTETSRRMTDELGSRQRDLSTSSVTKRANGHWHAIIASSCRWSQREYKRQPVHRINHVFAEEPSRAGDPAAQRWYSNCGDGTWRLRSLLQGTRVTYVTETFPFSRSLRVTSDDRQIGIPTKAPQELPLPAPCVDLLILPIRQTIGPGYTEKVDYCCP